MKQQQKETVFTMPAPRSTRTAVSRARVKLTPQQQAINTELSRLDKEHKRSYEAAAQGRLLSDWLISPGHINDDIKNALTTLRGRSRELYQNNAHVQNWYQLLETHVIGPDGFKFKCRVMQMKGGKLVPWTEVNDAAEYHWARFCARGVCDISGRHSMQSLLALATVTAARDGEAFLIKRKAVDKKKNPYGVAWQLIDTERLDTSYNRAATPAHGITPKQNAIVMGVEMDEYQRPVAYYFTETNATKAITTHAAKRTEVPESDVIHLFAQEHAEQVRGVPWMNAVMKSLHQLQMFEDYTLVAARIGASKTGFFYKDSPDRPEASALANGTDENGDLVIDAEPGMFQALPPGWKFQAFTPDFPAATFEAFVKSIKRSIANGLRIGYNTLFQDLSDVNYSSIRQDLIASRDMWQGLHKWVIETALVPMYEAFVVEGTANKAFVGGEYPIPPIATEALKRDYVFHGRTFPQIDPKADLESYKMLSDMGVISRVRIAEMVGEDIYAQGEEQAEYRDFVVSKDLNVVGINDPQVNAEMADKKEAREVQAQAMAQAAENASKQTEGTDTQAKVAAEERSAAFEALTRQFEAVQTTLREVLARNSSEKPVQLMTAEELGAALAAMAPKVEPVEPSQEQDLTAEELGQVLPELTPDLVEETAPDLVVETPQEPVEQPADTEQPDANTEALEQAVQELAAVVAELEADMSEQKEQEESANV